MAIRRLLVLVALTMFTGCGDQPETKQEDAATVEQHLSYVDMVSQIKSQKDVIATAFTDGKPDDAHHALHEVGNVLLEIAHVAELSSFGEQDLQEVHTAAATLLEAFGKLDAVMHKPADDTSEPTTYEDVSADVDTAVETLESKMELSGASESHAHSHGDGGHSHSHDGGH